MWNPYLTAALNLFVSPIAPSLRTVKKLLDNGADPCLSDHRNNTALHQALRYGRTDCVEVLLDGGALVDSINDVIFNNCNHR